MSVNTSSPRTQRNLLRSNSVNTNRTVATLATHQSLFSTVPPPSLRQTNNPSTRRQSLTKSTTASLAKMVPSLSKKWIDRDEQGSNSILIMNNTAQIQRARSFNVSSLPKQLSRRSSLKVYDTINAPSSSSSCTTTFNSNSNNNNNNNQHGSVLNSTVPAQHRRLSRDISSSSSSSSSIQHHRPSKQSKNETLDLQKNSIGSGSDGDEPHRKHMAHRRTSLAVSSTNTNLSPPLTHRRSSLVENSSLSAQEQEQEQHHQHQHHLRHPSWLDSAGFMRPSKCAACHPPPPKRTTVIAPPEGVVAVPSFAPHHHRRRRHHRQARPNLVFENHTVNVPSSQVEEKSPSSPPPSSSSSSSSSSRKRRSSDQLLENRTMMKSPEPLEQDSGFASVVEPRESSSTTDLLVKDSGSVSFMSEETVEARTRFTSPAASTCSAATSLSSVSVSVKSDLEQWTIQLRLALGRWFTDLNHGQLEHFDKDRSIMTITGIVVNMDSWLTLSTQPYRLRLGPDDRQQTFRCSATWTDDNAVGQCQFKTDTSPCECKFDWMNRRHHCRCCGNIFCKEHSSNRLPLFTSEKPNQIRWSRVCDTCCFHLVKSHLVL